MIYRQNFYRYRIYTFAKYLFDYITQRHILKCWPRSTHLRTHIIWHRM